MKFFGIKYRRKVVNDRENKKNKDTKKKMLKQMG